MNGEKYRVVKYFEGLPVWWSPVLSSTKADAELAEVQATHAQMRARQLRDDPRGEDSPVIKRLARWRIEKVATDDLIGVVLGSAAGAVTVGRKP